MRLNFLGYFILGPNGDSSPISCKGLVLLLPKLSVPKFFDIPLSTNFPADADSPVGMVMVCPELMVTISKTVGKPFDNQVLTSVQLPVC